MDNKWLYIPWHFFSCCPFSFIPFSQISHPTLSTSIQLNRSTCIKLAKARGELALCPSLLPAWQVEERCREQEFSPCSRFSSPREHPSSSFTLNSNVERSLACCASAPCSLGLATSSVI